MRARFHLRGFFGFLNCFLHHFSPRMRFAFARIFAALDALNLPLDTICVARALAFAACARSSMGHLRCDGIANFEVGIAFLASAVNFAIFNSMRCSASVVQKISVWVVPP